MPNSRENRPISPRDLRHFSKTGQFFAHFPRLHSHLFDISIRGPTGGQHKATGAAALSFEVREGRRLACPMWYMDRLFDLLLRVTIASFAIEVMAMSSRPLQH